jgi:2,3,4,5-tetrahydropyridine-2-carboxylate N-succinyltransferase
MFESVINQLFEKNPEEYDHQDMEHFQEFKRALNSGEARAAEPDSGSPHGWRVNPWVKRGILVGFRMGRTVDMSPGGGGFSFFDKSTFPTKNVGLEDGVRIVPGGSSIRDVLTSGKA